MKKNLFAVFALLIFMIFAAPAAEIAWGGEEAPGGGISIYVNDQLIGMEAEPFILNETTMVPLRFVSRELGASVVWKETKAEISYEGATIVLQPDSKAVSVNGKEGILSIPVQTRDGRLFVPLRFISEHFGAQVNFQNNEIDIQTDRPSPHGKSYNSPFDFADKKEGCYISVWDKDAGSYQILFAEKDSFAQTAIITDIYSNTSVNVVGQYIYYDDKGTLIRYDMQTEERDVISEKIYRAYVTGDAIIFMDTPTQMGGLWRMNLDGSDRKQISGTGYIFSYIVVGDTVYYCDTSNKLLKATTQGDGSQKLMDGFSHFAVRSNGYFYAANKAPGPDGLTGITEYGVLSRMKDGEYRLSTVLRLDDDLEDGMFESVSVAGNWVYYVPRYTGCYTMPDSPNIPRSAIYVGNLYRWSLDGQKKEQLTNVKTGDFYLFRGGFCYRNIDQNELVFCAN